MKILRAVRCYRGRLGLVYIRQSQSIVVIASENPAFFCAKYHVVQSVVQPLTVENIVSPRGLIQKAWGPVREQHEMPQQIHSTLAILDGRHRGNEFDRVGWMDDAPPRHCFRFFCGPESMEFASLQSLPSRPRLQICLWLLFLLSGRGNSG